MIAELSVEEDLRCMLAKATKDRAKLLIACRTALVRMRRGGFQDSIAEHILVAAINQAEPQP